MLVVLDPGHGVETPGKRSFDGSLRECEFNFDIARRQKAILESHGVKTILTRTNEHEVSLAQRVAIAKRYNADIFVSDHADAYGSTWNDANGYTVYTYTKIDSMTSRLASCVDNAMSTVGSIRNRGIKQADFYVLRNTPMPAILIEHGFYTNKIEVAKLKDTNVRQALAIAGAKGILQYFGIQYKGKEEDTLKAVVTYTGDGDVFAAILVSQKMHCPLMSINDFKASGIKAERVIQIGGKPGSDRFSSFKDAANLI
jgi:N-acetylmuramoyl-L-alanine amidase